MERYRILDHTADGKFRAFGETLGEAFANAALACASLMWDWEKVGRRVAHAVEIHGRDVEQLLYKFLEELLYLLDTRAFLLGGVEDLKIVEVERDPETGFRLTARFVGDEGLDRIEIHGSVKAVTYHEMKIEHRCGPWVVQAVVDM